MKPAERVPTSNTASLQRRARERADEQARRIPWQRLLEARNQYIEWQEFYLWVRSTLEVEKRIPDWLTEILNTRCPGFLDSENLISPTEAQERPVYLRLEDWIDEHVFGFAKREGWFSAIRFYAVREPRYQKAQACWSESVKKWKVARPARFPSFEEWKSTAAQCDDTAHLVAETRAARESAKRVGPEQLAEAVARYTDWEAFAYWARPALERSKQLPVEVASALERRCPGFLAAYSDIQQNTPGTPQPWPQLMGWIVEQQFQEAKAAGWLDAIISAVRIHPRAIRTQEYCDRCDEMWNSGLPVPYPSFEQWRRQADAYVELNDTSNS